MCAAAHCPRTPQETAYFAYAIDVANDWRELLGLPRDAKYDTVASGLGGLPLDPAEAAPTYSFNAEAACCYVDPASCPPGRFGGRDQCSPQGGHPSPAAVLGLFDGRRRGDRYGVDAVTANNTIAAITYKWQWSNGGGWGAQGASGEGAPWQRVPPLRVRPLSHSLPL